MVETIEVLLVLVVVLIQIFVFARTNLRIRLFRNIFPAASSFHIVPIPVPATDLEQLSPEEILANAARYLEEEQQAPEDRVQVNIIHCDVLPNDVLSRMLYAINKYLIRNRGAATDFNLVKDIVERNTEMVEEDINLTVAVPLYLGLVATMLGIVLGLFNMPDLNLPAGAGGKDLLLNDGISLLIGGVKIAMLASVAGLALTIVNSAWAFKRARIRNETKKNEFYTFVQVNLLPVINQGLASTLESLQRNLLKFNNEFSGNLHQLNGIFDANTTAIRAQKELLETIERTKMAEIAKYNIKVLQQLDTSVVQLEKFNNFLINMAAFATNSGQLVDRTHELLDRTDNLQVIAGKLDNRLDQSQQLLDFLAAHLKQLEQYRQYTADAVADAGHAIAGVLKELKEHIINVSAAMKNATVDEIEALKGALAQSKTNLSNLEHLKVLSKDVAVLTSNTATQHQSLQSLVSDLNKNMKASIVLLDKIQRNSLHYRIGMMARAVKNFFTPKEKSA